MRRFTLFIGVITSIIILLVTSFIVGQVQIERLRKVFGGSLEELVKVGSETLYQEDYDYELSLHPQKNDPDIKRVLLNKLITDSIILQSGQAQGLIKLDRSIFNSKKKDYVKRIASVKMVRDSVSTKTNGLEGKVVAIWFRNDRIGALGLEEGKKLAYDTLTELHNLVKNGAISIEEAGRRIQQNGELAQIDESYDVNAIYSFSAYPGKPITLSTEVDDALWKLPEGGTTDIYLADNKDSLTGETYEAYYLFGQVQKRNEEASGMPFDQWLVDKRENYEITYY